MIHYHLSPIRDVWGTDVMPSPNAQYETKDCMTYGASMNSFLTRTSNGWTLLATLGVVVGLLAAGIHRYRGPAPIAPEVADEAEPPRASGIRMRATLEELLGTPAEIHATATAGGEAFLQRLESAIDSLGGDHRRIEIPFDPQKQKYHPKGRIDLLPGNTVLQNLLATVPGREPDLAPLLIVTHHDSCRWGPGAGDAGSGVVTLLEHMRTLTEHRPRRTTHYLFTDGEEFGLLGAYAMVTLPELPFDEPAFVLNFDARGTCGGVPMFETHHGNANAVNQLINSLATPRITSSLAVTVYRSLPNATDFNVWNQEFAWPGFNFAVIGGAHHYHQPSDRPENLSDRTLQHMGDHLFSLHRAVDAMNETEIAAIGTPRESAGLSSNAVFFDILGLTVIHYRAITQMMFAAFSVVLIAASWWISRPADRCRPLLWAAAFGLLALLGGGVIGWVVQLVTTLSPWSNLRYTPVDLAVGVMSVLGSFLGATFFLEFVFARAGSWHRAESPRGMEWLLSDDIADEVWLGIACIGLVASLLIPGGAYLLVLPSALYAAVRIATRSRRTAAWIGWLGLAVLIVPMLTLLVQALGPWQQPLYGALSGMLAATAAPLWMRWIKPATLQSDPHPHQS